MRRSIIRIVLSFSLMAGAAYGDGLLDFAPNAIPPFNTTTTLFPNWMMAPTSAFQVEECDDTVCTGTTNCPITGFTVMNYGTASGGPGADIVGVYFLVTCGSKTNSGILTMTYAGNWTVPLSGTYPAWTWAGSIPWGGDPCSAPSFGCSCFPAVMLYTDIGPCPTDGATLELGPGFNDTLDPANPGGMYDSCGFAAPYGPVSDAVIKTIRYAMKQADKDVAAPGDTVNYTIYYGRPGLGSLTDIIITDTMPPFTHLATFGIPGPDPGWNPDIGPPLRLRWTIPGPLPTAFGPTSMITYGVTVDWGNGEAFEPGSGDVAAPEGAFFFNTAHISWDPPLGCPAGRTSNAPTTVVKRYQFWKIGDNDVLFAPRMGQADDEIIYSIFVKNVSASKTWWNCRIWDTVPAEIDPWQVGQGFEDPCSGWTMTPSGCAAASPGHKVAGATTILTWQIDLPPGSTLTVRWKGVVKQNTTVGAVVTNKASVRAYGQTGIIGGTGDAQADRGFTHEATVVLRTTFISYVGWAGATNNWFKGCVTNTYFISFYPLNKAADFQLYKKWCCASAPCDAVTPCGPFAANGGVSPKIDVFAGTCTGGPPIDWEMGCKVERSPARYVPNDFVTGSQPPFPFNFLHKMVSNCPLVWELSMCLGGGNQDANTWAGMSSLNFAGYIAYAYCRVFSPNLVLDSLQIVNVDDNNPTTLFIFAWNAATLTWDLAGSEDVFNGSTWTFIPPAPNHYRILSSNTRLMVHKAFIGIGSGGAYNDFGTLAPNRENGNLVNTAAPATFYLFAGHIPGASDAAIIGNVGATDAAYEVWRYAPFDPTAANPDPYNISVDTVSNAGSWNYVTTATVPAGFTNPANAHVYGPNYDPGTFTTRYRLYKVKLLSGGPIQCFHGRSIINTYSGGAMMAASRDLLGNVGTQVGVEYWFHSDEGGATCTGYDAIQVVDIFCPKVNLVMQGQSQDGYSATYTTSDVDECVGFMSISPPAASTRRNWKFMVNTGAGNPGDVIAQYIACNIGEKFYTAPFLRRGVFYNIIGPPTVFVGQSFWLTIVVIDSGGGTKQDYCGTSSFTSTDAGGQIEGTPMDAYNFTWTSSTGACNIPPNENGVRVFVNVTLTRLGLQTIVGSDTADGSITGLYTVMVVGADVKLFKQPLFTIAASGDTVQFKVCWSNYSSASAFSFVITDAVPLGTTFLPEAGTAAFNGGSTDGVILDVAYSTATTAAPPASFVTGNPIAGTRWLRWTVPMSGVQTTGCAVYRVAVN